MYSYLHQTLHSALRDTCLVCRFVIYKCSLACKHVEPANMPSSYAILQRDTVTVNYCGDASNSSSNAFHILNQRASKHCRSQRFGAEFKSQTRSCFSKRAYELTSRPVHCRTLRSFASNSQFPEAAASLFVSNLLHAFPLL